MFSDGINGVGKPILHPFSHSRPDAFYPRDCRSISKGLDSINLFVAT